MIRKINRLLCSLCLGIFSVICMTSCTSTDDGCAGVSLVNKNILALGDCWNQQNMDCVVSYYMDSPKTVYISGSTIFKGYQNIVAHYKSRFPHDMGQLKLTPFYSRILSNDKILVVSKFDLNYQNKHYLGTTALIWQKDANKQWRIIFDHS